MDTFMLNAPAAMPSTIDIVMAMLMAFILSMAVAASYRWSHAGLSYSRGFVHTQVLGAIVTCMLIMAIGNNLARGLGILGTLAIIRFRTPIRDPRDIIFLFACLAIGIASGAAVFSVVPSAGNCTRRVGRLAVSVVIRTHTSSRSAPSRFRATSPMASASPPLHAIVMSSSMRPPSPAWPDRTSASTPPT